MKTWPESHFSMMKRISSRRLVNFIRRNGTEWNHTILTILYDHKIQGLFSTFEFKNLRIIYKTRERAPKRTLSTVSSTTRISRSSALRKQRREISDNMALLMAKTNTNLILSWIALILCFPFGIPALVLAYSVRVSTIFYHNDLFL